MAADALDVSVRWAGAGRPCVGGKKQDVEKARFWRAAIREAARSGVSIREFCRRRKLKEGQFYWWQRRLSMSRRSAEAGRKRRPGGPASFALVSEERGANDAGIELVLAGGRRLRIARGVDEATLRAVLAAVEPAGC
jgi:transposase-like protein